MVDGHSRVPPLSAPVGEEVLEPSKPVVEPGPPQFRFVDLFAGIGGFHHALSHPDFGGTCALAVELDERCRSVYGIAFPGVQIVHNVRELTMTGNSDATPDEIRSRVPPHEVLCAGFPCQPFSKSGGQLGVEDRTRGTLFHDIMAIVRARKPRYVFLENVPNLVGPKHRDTWGTIIETLWATGYRVARIPVVLSPHRLPNPIGSPQIRERVFILAHRTDASVGGDETPVFDRRMLLGWNPNSWSITDLLNDVDQGAQAYGLRDTEATWLNAWDSFIRAIPAEQLPGFPLWADEWRDAAPQLDGVPGWKQVFMMKNRAFYEAYKQPIDEWLSQRWPPLNQIVAEFPASRRKFEWQARGAHPSPEMRTVFDLLIHFRPSGIRVRPPTYVPALVAINQTTVVGERRRRLTPREAASLQQIPFLPFQLASMPDKDIYRQLGNAVHVGVVRMLAALLFMRGGSQWGNSTLADIPLLQSALDLAA